MSKKLLNKHHRTEKWQNLMPDYIMGTASTKDRKALDQHLLSCTACQQEVTSLTESLQLLSLVTPHVQPPADLRNKVLAQTQPTKLTPSKKLIKYGLLVGAGGLTYIAVKRYRATPAPA